MCEWKAQAIEVSCSIVYVAVSCVITGTLVPVLGIRTTPISAFQPPLKQHILIHSYDVIAIPRSIAHLNFRRKRATVTVSLLT